MAASSSSPPSTETDASITVDVRFFSLLREKTGQSEVTVSLPQNTTGTDLIDHLESEYPAIAEARSAIRLAVNQSYVAADTTLQDGDEVALITPVSGG